MNPQFNISPINFYGATGEDDYQTTPDKTDTPTHNRSISYWNLNLCGNPNPETGGGVTISNLNTAIHSRNDSKVTATGRHPEESNLEIKENLKFIEELLNDGAGDASALTMTAGGENSFGAGF